MYNINNFAGLRSLLFGFAIYKATSVFTTYFKDSINPNYANHKIHYDAAISFVGSALTGSSLSVNLLFLANHYIESNNFFTDATKKKYYLEYVTPAIGVAAFLLHTQEATLAFKLLGSALKYGGHFASKYVLPSFYAKCTTILSTGTIGAIGYIGFYFAAPIYFINKAANEQTTISNWSFDKACLVLSMKEGRSAEEEEVVTKYKNLRSEAMNLNGAAGRNLNSLSVYEWLNSSYIDQDGYDKFSALQKYINTQTEANKLDIYKMTETDKNRDFLTHINANSSNAGLACIASGAAGLVALFAPSALAIPLILAAACAAPVASHYANSVKSRFNGEINTLLNPPAPDRVRT